MTALAYSYIRFSSKQQAQGDSLRRQTEATAAYAKAHGWQLDESLRDLGVSAYSGKNRTEGSLKRFLKLVNDGTVARGSWLIIEAMDRLSREQVSDALTLFLSIINAGVGIVTLTDNKQYTSKSINENPFEIMYSIGLMAGAHEYSKKLSDRTRAAWGAKRKDCSKPIHGRPPFWLDKTPTKYVFNAEYAKLMRRIITLAMAGQGAVAITHVLNREGSQTRRGKHWTDATIAHVLSTKALIGHYQPTLVTNGKRVPTGDPVSNYYPALLTEPEFYKLQSILDARRKVCGGRTGNNVPNIFGKLLRSGVNGSGMIVVTKRNGTTSKVYKSLESNAAIQGAAKCASFPYEPLELAFLTFIRQVLATATPTAADNDVAERQGRLLETQARIKAMNAALDTTPPELIGPAMQSLARMEKTRIQQEAELAAAQAEAHKPTADFDTTDRQQIKLNVGQIVKAAKVWVAGNTVKRAAVMQVVFHDGKARMFGVRTERSTPAIMVYWGRVTNQTPEDAQPMLDALVRGDLAAAGNVQVELTPQGPALTARISPAKTSELRGTLRDIGLGLAKAKA